MSERDFVALARANGITEDYNYLLTDARNLVLADDLQRLDTSLRDLGTTRSELDALRDRFNTTNQTLTGVRTDLSTVRGQLDTTRGQLDTTRQQNTALQNQLQTLQREYEALQRRQNRPVGQGGNIVGGAVVDDGSSLNDGGGGAGMATGGPVYGPDGRMFSSAAAAIAAGVTNFSRVRPTLAPGLINGADQMAPISITPPSVTGNVNAGAQIPGTAQQLFNAGGPRVRFPSRA